MKRVSHYLPLFLLIFCLGACKKGEVNTPPPSEQKDIEGVDKVIADWMSKYQMPGASLAVSRNGKLVYAKGYGEAIRDTHKKVTTESVFRIASVSKLITSAAILKLVQDGKVSMDDKVFGAIGILGTTFGTQPYKPYVADISVSDLLHHTGGGWGQDNDPAFFDISQDKTAIINWTLNNLPLVNKSGTKFSYSNFGYMLLAEIVAKVSGQTYQQYVNQEIWAKTGAKNSFIAGSELSEKAADEVMYYGQGSDASHEYTMNLARAAGAMGWASTPTDLLRFATAVDSSGTRPDILSPATIKIMTTTTSASSGFGFNFGCGWVVEGNEWFWWGSLPGTFALLYRNGNGICLAITANSRRQPNPENALNAFLNVINYVAFQKDIPWQDIDQFN